MKFIVKVPIYVCKDMMFILNSQEHHIKVDIRNLILSRVCDESASYGVKVVLITGNEPHCHAEVDFRDGDEDRGGCLADHLVDSEESFIMSDECVGKN